MLEQRLRVLARRLQVVSEGAERDLIQREHAVLDVGERIGVDVHVPAKTDGLAVRAQGGELVGRAELGVRRRLVAGGLQACLDGGVVVGQRRRGLRRRLRHLGLRLAALEPRQAGEQVA